MEQRRKSGRLVPAAAAAFGLALLMFELRHIQSSGAEGWFWLIVAGLMVLLGLIGVFQKPPEED